MLSQKDRTLLGDPDKTLYLIDISSFIFRAFFAIRALTNSKGEPTNAVYGVASMLARLVEEASPKYMAVAYDSKEASFRETLYEEYKSNRTAPPDDLVPQFAMIDELVTCMRFHSYREPGVEADDIIATFCKKWCAQGKDRKVVVVTGDKDLMQLVNDQVVVWDTMKQVIYDEEGVTQKFEVKPEQVRDYLALVGDSSDNVPGVPSIGPKSAVQLLKEHGDLAGVLKAAQEGKVSGKKGAVLNEFKAQALLSAELVTLKEDIQIEANEKDLAFDFKLYPECAKFLKDLEFDSILKRWKEKFGEGAARADAPPSMETPAEASTDVAQPDQAKFTTILKEKDLDRVLAEIEKRKAFAIDLETTSLNPRAAQVVGISLAYDVSEGFYIPVGHKNAPEQLSKELVIKKILPFLKDDAYRKIGQNLKYDWSVLLCGHDIPPAHASSDTMVASYVLNPIGKHGFDALCERYLGYQTLKYEDVCGKGKDQIGFDEVDLEKATRYAAEDAVYTLRLWEKLSADLKKEKLFEVYDVYDEPLVPILAKMECEGVRVDVPWLQKISEKFGQELDAIEKKIQAHLPPSESPEPINLNSPKQLAKLLFEDLKLPSQGKTKTGLSTDASVLKALSPLHEVPRLLLEYREISKLKGTYVDPLPQMVDPKTGRVHAGFHQAVTATGRLSSSDPNLQNIPVRTERGQMIRKAFIPAEGNLLLSADYSQIELRLLAHMSGDKNLIASFKNGEDVHQRTASEIFHIDPKEVDSHQRSVAKAINFGLMYGKTAFGLAQELNIPRGEAKDIIDRYFKRYHSVKKYLDGLIESAHEKGFVETLSGRKRLLPEIHSKNHAFRTNAERMAMNTPIQGTAADLMKLAMIKVAQALDQGKFKSKLIIQVHDEVVLDCPRGEIAEVQKLVCHEMEHAMKLEVPLSVNSATGEDWSVL